MRQKHLLTKLMLLVAVVLMGAGTAWAADETITFSEEGLSNGIQYTSFDGTDFTVSFGDGTNDGKYYTTGAAIRVYSSGHMTVASNTKTIAKIELTFGSGDGTNTITTNVGTYSNGTWEGEASSVTFNVGGTSGHRRIASVAVTYAAGSTSTATLVSIALSGDYPTTFTEGDDFSHEGMVVTATYDDTTTKNVTSKAIFTGYNMSTTGSQTVTVSYTEGEVTKTVEYGITVDAIPTHTVTWSVNGTTTTDTFKEGAAITFPANPANIESKIFVGWVADAISGVTDTAPTFVTSATMGSADITYYAVFADKVTGNATMTDDELTATLIGQSGYGNWTGKTASSNAVYAGNSTTSDNNAIQIRSKDNSGIVTTASGGKVTKIAVEWEGTTADGRTLNIYGKNKAYSSAADLYNSSSTTQGTLLGTIVYGTSTELTISGDYEFIGMRSANNAMYFDKITITWMNGTPDTYSGYCTTVAADTRAEAELSFSNTKVNATIGTAFTPPTLNTATGFNGTVEYSSSDESVAQIMDMETGEVRLVAEGTTTITATFAGNADFKAGSASYELTVTDNRIATTITQDDIVLSKSEVGTFTRLAPVVKDANGNTIDYQYDVFPTDVSFEYDIDSDVNTVISSLDWNTGEITLSGAVGTVTMKAYYNPYNSNSTYKPSECTFTITVEDLVTIADARAQATGDVTTKGVVTSCSGTTAYIQDATAAICVYGKSLTVGDEVKVSGTLTDYKGLLEITNPSVTVLSQNNTVTPEVMTIAEINASTNQGWLVKIEDATVTEIDGQNTTIAQGSDEIVVRGISGVDYNVNDVLTLTGNIGCYNTAQIANPTNVIVQQVVTPSITVDPTTVNATAAETDGTITVTYNNITTVVAEVQFFEADGTTAATYDWILTDINASNNVDYTIAANTGAARTAYMKVYALDDNTNDVYSELITINQAAYVAPDPTIDPAVAGTGAFVKVTDDADLTAGQYLIVYEEGNVAFNGGLETLDAVGNTINVGIVDNKIIADATTVAATFTIKPNSKTIQSASGKFIGQTGNSNGLVADSETSYENTISINDEENADIISGGAYLRYNSSSNQLRFRYYKSSSYTGQKAIQLYKYDATATVDNLDITISDAGYRTYCFGSALDFEGTGLTAYKATVSNKQVSFTEVTEIPANAGVLLKGAAGTYQIPVIASAAALEGNAFVGVLNDTEVDAGSFVLLNGNSGVGFYKTTKAFTVGAHTAYLPASVGGARSFIGFDGETTGVNAVNGEGFMVNGSVYDLQGRRVAQPQKGLYIVNGKKVVIK